MKAWDALLEKGWPWDWGWEAEKWGVLVNVTAIVAASIGVWRANVRADRATRDNKRAIKIAEQSLDHQKWEAERRHRAVPSLSTAIDFSNDLSNMEFICFNGGELTADELSIFAYCHLRDQIEPTSLAFIKTHGGRSSSRLTPGQKRSYFLDIPGWISLNLNREFADSKDVVRQISNPIGIVLKWKDSRSRIEQVQLFLEEKDGLGWLFWLEEGADEIEISSEAIA